MTEASPLTHNAEAQGSPLGLDFLSGTGIYAVNPKKTSVQPALLRSAKV